MVEENESVISKKHSMVNPSLLSLIVVEKENDLDSAPLNYSDVIIRYPILMTTMAAFIVNFMFNFFSPITVIRFIVM